MGKKEARFLNRELSWLEFNERVLGEARDPAVPLLERLKFLAITASNLDEFFMVRVGGLAMLLEQGARSPDESGMRPRALLTAVRARVRRMVASQYACFLEELEPALRRAGVRVLPGRELDDEARGYAERHFERDVFPLLTPMAVDRESPLPSIAGLALHLAVRLGGVDGAGRPRFALVPLPAPVGRFLALPAEDGHACVTAEEVLRLFLGRLFPGQAVEEGVLFRVTRNADMSVQEYEAPDLAAQMEKVLDARKDGGVIRLEVEKRCSAVLLGFLQEVLEVGDAGTYRCEGPLDLRGFMAMAGLEGFEDLKYEPWPAVEPEDLDPARGMFAVLSRRDVLLCHPYEGFDPVLRLLQEAAVDPDVLAIKQILYRTSRDSPVVAALARAASLGKSVTALVELKARFDEARNIEWARRLEREGVQVIYGVKGYKTHAKVTVILRREKRGIVRYMHFGTGNYNEATARLYGDVSYLTAREDYGRDATAFFNIVTGYAQPQDFARLAMAPLGLRERILGLIGEETRRRRHGQRACIMAKVNALVDTKVIEALYEASQAGVRVLLNVRGICCLRPGVPGLSENIRVVSVVDRFLEHSRVLWFLHGGEELTFISSADWMPRNLLRRVELLVPVADETCRARLKGMLETHFRDTAKAHDLRPDGSYGRVKPRPRQRPFRSQEALYLQAVEERKAARRRKRTTFEPHRPPRAEEART